MQATDTVTVYSFRMFELDAETYHVAPFKASRELISDRFGGEVLEGTGLDVEAESLDAQGRYRRVATGWGALG